MHAIADVVRRAHDHGPRASCSACNDGLVKRVGRGDLELGAIAAVQDLAMVHDFVVHVDRGQVAPADGQNGDTRPRPKGWDVND